MNENFKNIQALISNNISVEIDGVDFKVRGLNLEDISYMIDFIPKKLLLQFIEGFQDKDIQSIEDYLLSETERNFVEIYHSVVACGLDMRGQEEMISQMKEINKLEIFYIVLELTLPKNKKEMEILEKTVNNVKAGDAKKLKAIMNHFLEITRELMN